MKIGCPKEIKNQEYRVGITPNAARAYVQAGHGVYVEAGAGEGSSIGDDEYRAAGAEVLPHAGEIWNSSDMIIKVKEPLEPEYRLMRENQIVYTYFHFAADAPLLRACLERKIMALAYETVQDAHGLPLLKPMSEVAGRMSVLMGAFYSARTQGGRGLLAMGVPGVAPAEVLIIGGGTVGTNAAHIAAGLGTRVTILDVNLNRLEYLGETCPPNVNPVYNDPLILESYLRTADIIIGAVLIPGAKTPKLVKREHLKLLKKGAVLVDVAIDQGGCFETSHPTTHSDPVYTIEGALHYCVANMPGAYARTATFALNNATLGYGLQIANLGLGKAVRQNAALLKGLNTCRGIITCLPVADAAGRPEDYRDPLSLI